MVSTFSANTTPGPAHRSTSSWSLDSADTVLDDRYQVEKRIARFTPLVIVQRQGVALLRQRRPAATGLLIPGDAVEDLDDPTMNRLIPASPRRLPSSITRISQAITLRTSSSEVTPAAAPIRPAWRSVNIPSAMAALRMSSA